MCFHDWWKSLTTVDGSVFVRKSGTRFCANATEMCTRLVKSQIIGVFSHKHWSSSNIIGVSWQIHNFAIDLTSLRSSCRCWRWHYATSSMCALLMRVTVPCFHTDISAWCHLLNDSIAWDKPSCFDVAMATRSSLTGVSGWTHTPLTSTRAHLYYSWSVSRLSASQQQQHNVSYTMPLFAYAGGSDWMTCHELGHAS